MEGEHIIALLVADIQHNSLINGLQEIGLTDNDRYLLKLDLLVAELLGHTTGKVPNAWLDVYQATMLSVPPNITSKEAHSQAEILYLALTAI